MIHPDKQKGRRVLESNAVDSCDCGGTLFDERIATGRIIVNLWDSEQFDPDEFRLHSEYEETEGRVRCNNCQAGWTY